MQLYIRSIITLLAVINPVICGVMLLQIDGGLPLKHKLYDATKAALSALRIVNFIKTSNQSGAMRC